MEQLQGRDQHKCTWQDGQRGMPGKLCTLQPGGPSAELWQQEPHRWGEPRLQ